MQPTEMKKLMDIVAGRTAYSAMLESIQGDEYKQLYITWYNLGPALTEAKLTQDQVDAIFQAVADGAKAGKNVASGEADPSSNRTLLGKGTDAASKVADAWNKFKEKIAQSGPVSGFDVAFDSAQKKLLNAAGGESGKIGKALNAYKEFANKYPKMQGAIYAGLIILSGISGWGLGGAAILAGIRTMDRLLQGDRASSALWKGFKTGALSYGASHLLGHGGPDAGGGDTTGSDTTNVPNVPDIESYTVQQGDTLSQIAQSHGVSVADLKGLNPDITNPDVLQPGQTINLPPPNGSDVYAGGTGTYSDTADQIARGNYSDSPISHRLDNVQHSGQQTPDAPSPEAPATQPSGGSQLSPKGDNWQNYADAGQQAGQAATQAPYGANMSDEYLKKVIQADENGVRMRFLISPEDARKALEWKLQNGGTVAGRALGESFNGAKIMRTWMLQESMRLPLQSKLYLTPAGVERIFEAISKKELVNEGIWDSIKDTVSKGWESATNKITYNKLKLWWNKNYGDQTAAGDVDTQEVIDFLKKMGVEEALIKQVFTELKIPTDATVSPDRVDPTMDPEGTPAQATKSNPNQMAAELKALWDKWREEGASTGAPAVRAQLKDMWMSSGGTGTMAEGRKIRK